MKLLSDNHGQLMTPYYANKLNGVWSHIFPSILQVNMCGKYDIYEVSVVEHVDGDYFAGVDDDDSGYFYAIYNSLPIVRSCCGVPQHKIRRVKIIDLNNLPIITVPKLLSL